MKSGRKPTLTSQQKAAFHEVVREVHYAHPVTATVDMVDLPQEYSLSVTMYEGSDWGDGTSRYPTDD